MTSYILHVAIILALCLLFYKLLLQQQTYYRLNRVVLLICLVLAFLLPFVPVPASFSLRSPAQIINIDQPKTISNVVSPISENITNSVESSVTNTADTGNQLGSHIATWTLWIYCSGVICFGLNFLVQLIVLWRQAFTKMSIKDGLYRIVELDNGKAPCSFVNWIFIDPAKYDWETYNQILMHEKVHVRQAHSIDLVLAELMLVFQWFNPFAWHYRKVIENNLEFLTDDAVLTENNVEMADYQLSLLKVSVPNFAMHLTTSYNQSFLKKRIAMMSAKRSNFHTVWKYLMMIPLFLVMLGVLNQPVAKPLAINKKPNHVKPDNSQKQVIAGHQQLLRAGSATSLSTQESGNQNGSLQPFPTSIKKGPVNSSSYQISSKTLPLKDNDLKEIQNTFDSLKVKSNTSPDQQQIITDINELKAKLFHQLESLDKTASPTVTNPEVKKRKAEIQNIQALLATQLSLISEKTRQADAKLKTDTQPTASAHSHSRPVKKPKVKSGP